MSTSYRGLFRVSQGNFPDLIYHPASVKQQNSNASSQAAKFNNFLYDRICFWSGSAQAWR